MSSNNNDAGSPLASTVVTLRNGVTMPQLGLGVFKVESGAETVSSVAAALRAGYRHIDTATLYGNEADVGAAIAASGVPREQIFVTTKLANPDHGYEEALAACERSLQALGMAYVDLYLIHWPGGVETIKKNGKKYLDTWRAFETLYEQKKVRAIGLSNFEPHHIDDILAVCKVPPMVNQVELHPRLTQAPLRAYCASKQIVVEAWSPLGRGALLGDDGLAAIAAAHGKSVAQVLIRWGLQHGIVTIPKSVHEARIKENANVFDFALTDAEMDAMDAMNRDERVGSHPDKKEFF